MHNQELINETGVHISILKFQFPQGVVKVKITWSELTPNAELILRYVTDELGYLVTVTAGLLIQTDVHGSFRALW